MLAGSVFGFLLALAFSNRWDGPAGVFDIFSCVGHGLAIGALTGITSDFFWARSPGELRRRAADEVRWSMYALAGLAAALLGLIQCFVIVGTANGPPPAQFSYWPLIVGMVEALVTLIMLTALRYFWTTHETDLIPQAIEIPNEGMTVRDERALVKHETAIPMERSEPLHQGTPPPDEDAPVVDQAIPAVEETDPTQTPKKQAMPTPTVDAPEE